MTATRRRDGATGSLRLVARIDAPRPGRAPARSPLLDDSEILASMRRGDAGAATALHDRVRPTIDRTIRRLLGSGDRDHEDVAQLAMVELVTTVDRYRGECALDSWTGTLTARLVFKTIRKRKLERRYFSFDDAAPDVPSARHPHRDVVARDMLRRIEEMLAPVEDVKVWTFLLHDAWGYDLKEVAQITEATVAAAQTRLVRGRAEVHARLEADPELAEALAKELGS